MLCSLLSALRCALGVAPPSQDGTGAAEADQEEQQLVVAAVQGLVSRVAALAKDKETLEAEEDRWGREQRSLRAQLASSVEELQRATAARDKLSTENERLLEEASRLRLQLQELGWERASLGDQLHEATRRLELLQRLQVGCCTLAPPSAGTRVGAATTASATSKQAQWQMPAPVTNGDILIWNLSTS